MNIKRRSFKMAEIINGKELAQKIRLGLKDEVIELKKEGINPKLAVIMVGDDKASKVYVKNKSKACEEIGIEYEEFLMDENTTMEELLSVIDELNNRKDIHGILLQSPIPKHLDINLAFNKIDYRKDVDGFNPINVGKLSIGEDCFVSCTPFGVVKMLEEYNIDVQGKNVVIIGRSNIVGKPLIQCMLKKNGTVTVCHSKTQNIKEITKNADILIAALGKAKFVTADMVKDGAVIIDVGINRNEDGKLVGDVDFQNVEKKASFITPVPGGVGPMTIAMLMTNVVKAAKNLK
jgi:methylenetetrahydrofolate dehydrogenase (NADP+)/methenyltetrahydrofolate cyclohydrolase